MINKIFANRKMIRANPMGKGLPLIPPGHPRMTLFPYGRPRMARGGIRTEGSTVNTLGKRLKRGGKM